MNTKLIALPERAVEMAGKWGGELLDLGSQISARGEKWLDTGAKLGALKAGTKVATKVVRRYPIVTVATVAGAGLLWYLARRKAEQAENGDGRAAIEGSSRRVDARRSNGAKRATRTTTARKTTRARSTPATDET